MIPESPEYLYSYYKFPECKKILHQIAEWNTPKNKISIKRGNTSSTQIGDETVDTKGSAPQETLNKISTEIKNE